jgi:hypothetical protein
MKYIVQHCTLHYTCLASSKPHPDTNGTSRLCYVVSEFKMRFSKYANTTKRLPTIFWVSSAFDL